MKRRVTRGGHRRVVTISVCLPVTVELLVETMDDQVDESTDWDIAEVRRSWCSPYPAQISEQLDDDEHADMYKKALAAEDV